MIPEHVLIDMDRARKALFKGKFVECDFEDGSTLNNKMENIVIYHYVNGKHKVDLIVQNYMNKERRFDIQLCFVHNWGPSEDEFDWGYGLDHIIHKLECWEKVNNFVSALGEIQI